MQQPHRPTRRLPFEHVREIGKLDTIIQERVSTRAQIMREGVIPSTNVQRLKHGRQWVATNSYKPDEPTETVLHSTEMSISFESILNHEVGILERFLIEIPNEMHKQFMSSMYDTVREATESSGNVVSDKDFKAGFMEAIKRIVFGVDRWGVPSAPELHVHPEMATKIEQYSREPDAAYDEEIRRITEQKKLEAITDEARRITRYKFR
ncbi:MAG: hypothetical protein ABL907_21860 [Hyphomicrobium sp.]